MLDHREEAFLRIQNNLELYSKWCDAKTEIERTNMLIDSAWCIGYRKGIEYGEKIGESKGYKRGYNDAY